MLLVLVRHAEPERVDAAADGRADPGLTPAGHEQARRLAGALSGTRVDALVTSPMRRARETAAPAATALGFGEGAVEVVDDLVEYDADRDHYLPVERMAVDRPDDWERMRAGHLPADVDAEAFTTRVVAALEGVVAAHPGHATAVVVAHAGVVNAYLASVLGIGVALPFPLDYTGITRVLCARAGRRRVRTVNEVAHVADLLERDAR